jgi:hypothetical protein
MAESAKERRKQQETELVRVEPNIERLPIFAATRVSKQGDQFFEWKTQGWDPVTRRPISQKITLRAGAGLHLPGTVERDLYYLVLCRYIDEHGFDDLGRIGPVSYREVCELLGYHKSGANYARIKKCLEALASMSVKLEYCVYDGRKKELITVVDHLCSAQIYEREQAENTGYNLSPGEFLVRFAPWYVENYRANYTKPLDLHVYESLPRRAGIAKALFSYLDKVAYDVRAGGLRSEWSEAMDELAKRFQVKASAAKKVAQQFNRAHALLLKHWPLLEDASVNFQGRGRYLCVYRFRNQPKLPFSANGDQDKQAVPEDKDEFVDELVRRGIRIDQAKRDVRQFDPERIRRHLDIFDEEKKTGVVFTNPGGRLHKWIAGDLPPFVGYKPPELREAVRRSREEEAQKRRAEQDAVRADREAFEAKSPEDKARERTARRIMVLESLEKRRVAEAERESIYQGFLAEYRGSERKIGG